MGRQRWPPSTAPSMMACLHVETPSICTGKFKSALKAPAALHERIRSLDRARTGNILKHKLCRRPARSELVRMHILQESKAHASVQAAQLKLKRARLADDLNQKIAHRPGPMELVEKNILPADGGVNKDHDGDSPDPSEAIDVYAFNEDNNDPLSPRTCCQTSPSTDSVSPTPTEAASLSCSGSSVRQPSPSNPSSHLSSTSEQPAASSQPITATLTKQSSPKPAGEKSRSKKSREAKPRIRKLKYHQYVPPDHQKHELKPSPAAAAAHADAAYARLLQQQQHFLQLQILSQQRFGRQQPAVKSTGNFRTNRSAEFSNENCKPDQLPANVDEMKVAELKVELKLRSLPVSGTKMDLIERLKSYHETVAGLETKVPKNTPALSPKVSSGAGLMDNGRTDSPAAPPPGRTRYHEKDRRLHEKELQIEELKRRLEHEQRLVEELKLQLEVEKRSQQLGESPPPGLGPPSPLRDKRVDIKQEDVETSPSAPPAAEVDNAEPLMKTWTGQRTTQSVHDPFPSGVTKAPMSEPVHRGHSPAFTPPPPLKCKFLREPPRYEDAVKHARMLPALQGLCAASQQMDDLFDILIESGEMSPFLKPDPPDANKRLPVTPSVTLLPVNAVLSRPPPCVQVAHMPAEELPLPLIAMEMGLDDSMDAESDVHGMDWLDLSVSAAESVFSADFLDAYQLL